MSLSGRTGDGAHTHVIEITSGLRRLGWDVTLVEPRFRTNTPGVIPRLVQFLTTQLRLRRAVDAGGGRGILYIRTHPFTLPSVRFGARRSMVVVSEVNGPIEDVNLMFPRFTAARRLLRWSRRRQLEISTALVTVSDHIRGEIEAATDHPVEIITSGANTDIFHPGATTDVELPDRFVLYFGALAPWQSIDTVLDAVAEPAWPDGVAVVIAGDGTMRDRVEQAAAESPLVHYLGSVDQQRLAGVLARAVAGLSIQDSSMRHDTTPTKLFETMAAGIPVIVSDVPKQNELVRKQRCGLVIPPKSTRHLAEAVAALDLDDEQRRSMGERGRRSVVRDHSWHARARQTDRFLRSLNSP